jgi:hypothetical protein
MSVGRIRGDVGEVVVKHLSGGDGLGEREFAAFLHRAVLRGNLSVARGDMILGAVADSGF